ncbi:MAG: ribonuclease J [Clostridiales bacterium]|nr:MAG: ribonuclease J [Clostridiales bacterium]
MKKVLKIIPLGGLNEIGKNMTAYEYGNNIVIVDCGVKFPEDEMLGIDLVIPNFNYLIENKEKIRALLITHGHEDHIGGIPFFLQDIDVPIYTAKLTAALIRRKLEEHPQLPKVRINEITDGQEIKIGPYVVEFIRVNHSIPDAMAICIKTPLGAIIQTGDFKVDYTPIDNKPINLQRFAELGHEGVLALLADSTNAARPGYTMSESSVGDTFETLFRHADDKRIIVASFASNVHRLQQIVNAAIINDRKVAFSGRSMLNTVRVATEIDYLNIPENALIDVEDANRYPDNEICIVTTGSQGESMAALTRMANNDHFSVQIREGDLIILSSTPIPGNEKSVSRVINKLYEQGAEVVYNKLADVHVSGHACQEELKIIHSLVKPKYFIPVHGEFTHLMQHAGLAQKMGMGKDDIFIIENGDVIEFSAQGAKRAGKVESGSTLIDGLGVGDIGNVVLRDRRILSEEGLIMIVVAMNGDGKFLSGPDLVSRGFIYIRESEEFMNTARQKLQSKMAHIENEGIKEWAKVKSLLKNELSQYIYQEMRRRPIILPVIVNIQS